MGSRLGLMLSVVMVVGLWAVAAALGREPRHGGILNVALAGDPPSLDMHQEQTFWWPTLLPHLQQSGRVRPA